MDVGGASWKDHELAPLSRLVVNLPMKLGASVGHVGALEDPGQHSVHRFSGFVADCPVAVPALETLTRGVTLQIENRVHE